MGRAKPFSCLVWTFSHSVFPISLPQPVKFFFAAYAASESFLTFPVDVQGAQWEICTWTGSEKNAPTSEKLLPVGSLRVQISLSTLTSSKLLQDLEVKNYQTQLLIIGRPDEIITLPGRGRTSCSPVAGKTHIPSIINRWDQYFGQSVKEILLQMSNTTLATLTGEICCVFYQRSTFVACEQSAGLLKAWSSDSHISHPAWGSVWLTWQTLEEFQWPPAKYEENNILMLVLAAAWHSERLHEGYLNWYWFMYAQRLFSVVAMLV